MAGLCPGVRLTFLYVFACCLDQTAADKKSMDFALSPLNLYRFLNQSLGGAVCGVGFKDHLMKSLVEALSSVDETTHHDILDRRTSSLVQAVDLLTDNGSSKSNRRSLFLKIDWIIISALGAVVTTRQL